MGGPPERRKSKADQTRDAYVQWMEKIEEQWHKVLHLPRVKSFLERPTVARVIAFYKDRALYYAIPRAMVMTYFFNLIYVRLSLYINYNFGSTPYWEVCGLLPCVCACLVNYKVPYFGSVVALFALYDGGSIIWTQLERWWSFGMQLYVNELMVKKLATFGAVIAVMMIYYKQKIWRRSSIPGKPMEDNKQQWSWGTKRSVALLFSRILMSTLFVYVGWGEIQRQLETGGHFYTVQSEGNAHARPDGDGHDQMFFKLLQLLLSLPVLFGFQTRLYSFLLGTSLLAEAFIQWPFWSTSLGPRYEMHARDHFCVNIGVSGGMLLLASLGAGQYSMDEWLKKND